MNGIIKYPKWKCHYLSECSDIVRWGMVIGIIDFVISVNEVRKCIWIVVLFWADNLNFVFNIINKINN